MNSPADTRTEILPVILAGGSGTRLWPLSREAYPKQLLRVRGPNTLLQDTVLRLDGIGSGAEGGHEIPVAEPIVVCHEEHRFFVSDQLEGIGRRAGRILLEPVSRNTAPALTIAALAAADHCRDPALLVMPADHVIEDLAPFRAAVRAGLALARNGTVVTFGIVPTRAETGYGYIRKGDALDGDGSGVGYAIAEFVEKPDLAAAETYVDSGAYLWNAGLFLICASVWLEAIGRFGASISEACRLAWAGGTPDGSFYRVDREAFAACPTDSIDYAVMERIAGAGAAAAESGGFASAVVPLDAGWSDVGSWPALMALNPHDPEGNVTLGDVHTRNTRNSLVVSQHRLVTTVGVEDAIVVETADAVLVADRKDSQDIKQVVKWLKQSGRGEGTNHRRVYRPWGDYEQLDDGPRFQVKRLTVKPGAALSLQMHHHRAEHWVVVRGTARVTRGDEQFLLTENQSTYIPLGVTHRLENPGTLPLEVIEVQSGSYLGEDDIVRFEDRYNREAGS